MHKGKTKRIALFIFTLFSFLLVFSFLFFPEKTVDTVLGYLSEIEFRLLAKVSPWFTQNSEIEKSQILLGSHRGVVEESSVENSQQSIEAAFQNGFRFLEVDISFSSDLKPYLFHGPGLDLVGRYGNFSNYSSGEIDQWKLSNNEPIIALSRFCFLYANKFETIYLDVKGDNSHYKEKAQAIWREIENYETQHFVIIGTPWRVIKNVKNVLPRVNVGYEQKGAIANYLLGADTVSLYYKYEFSFAEYRLAKLLDLDILVWTINDLKLLKDYSQKFRLTVLTDLNKQEINL
jgi:glycerophosphoryl diester phosphodiesterase